MITMLACSVLMAAFISQPREASAAPQDITNLSMATWNMQGGTDSITSKWSTGVTALTNGRPSSTMFAHNIVALQEAGSRPVGQGNSTVAQSGSSRVTETLWRLPSSDTYRYVYFMETDPNGHRVNLAIVTDRVPREVRIVPSGLPDGRATFGVRFGTTWVFTLHALSRSHGSDAPGLLRNIETAVGGDSWVALGDFNRDPVNLTQAMPRDSTGNRIGVAAGTGLATHVNGRELDYMVTSGDLSGILAPARLANPGGADHTPVGFRSAMAAAATEYQITATDVPPGVGATVQIPSPAADAVIDDDRHGAENWRFHNYDPEDNSAQIANVDPDIGCMIFVESGAMRTAPCVAARDQVPPEQKMTIVDADVPGAGRDVEIRSAFKPENCLYLTYTLQQVSFSGRSQWRDCDRPGARTRAAADEGGGSHWILAPVHRVMVVGDSITQGREGDFTWRYRLWQWLRSQKVAVDFVGPYSGTFTPDQPAPPTPPRLPEEAPPSQGLRTSGGYAPDVSEPQNPGSGPPTDIAFDSDHYAHWGRQAAQVKQDIRQQVATYRPDLILLAIGFNDMGWFVSDEHGTLSDVGQIVAQARDAHPSVDFALANVPQRTKIGGRDDLIAKTDHYNRLLPQSIATWQADDPISNINLVDWAARYSCSPTSCPSGYDGLHPNEHGEYELAAAFAQVLHQDYGFGARDMDVPATVPARLTPAFPTNVRAVSSARGVTVTWDPVYGAVDYDVRSRIAGQTAWSQGRAFSNRTDTTWTVDGIGWEYQVRANMGCRWNTDPHDPRGCTETTSGWSATVGATAHPKTAPPPTSIASRPSATGVDVAWTPPTGPYTDTIDRYEIVLYDKDTPGAFLTGTGARGTVAHVDGLKPGHHYLVAVATWNAAGGGLPSLARPVTVGAGTPPAPTDLRVTSTDATTVQLNWKGSNAAAGYRVWVRNINGDDHDGGTSKADEDIVEGTSKGIGFLFPGVWNYEFCVTAVNGVYESGKSNCVVAPRPAGSRASGAVQAVPPSASDRARQDMRTLLDLPKQVSTSGAAPGR
jgi:lysophospholipase L1-like esterase